MIKVRKIFSLFLWNVEDEQAQIIMLLFIYVALSSPACTADGWVLSKSKHCSHWILPGTAVKCVWLQPATDVFYNCCMYSPCLPWFHWDPEHLERQEVLAPLYLPGRRWGFVCFLRNSKMYSRSMRKYNMATHRLSNYSLRPDFSTLASVTLQETSEVRMFGSKFGVFSWLKFSLFVFCFLSFTLGPGTPCIPASPGIPGSP